MFICIKLVYSQMNASCRTTFCLISDSVFVYLLIFQTHQNDFNSDAALYELYKYVCVYNEGVRYLLISGVIEIGSAYN